MKTTAATIVSLALIIISFMTSCAQATNIFETVIATNTPISTPTVVPSLPIPTATWWQFPVTTATPIHATLNSDADLHKIMKGIFPLICNKENMLSATPPYMDIRPPSKLNFIEVDVQPNTSTYWISAIADNTDSSRQAFIACKPDYLSESGGIACEQQIYVKDKKNEKVYEIDWDKFPRRPIERIIWINTDILAFFQSGSPHFGQIIAINLDRKKYQYYGFDSLDCAPASPTP